MKIRFSKIFAIILSCLPLFIENVFFANPYREKEPIVGKCINPDQSYDEVRKVVLGSGMESVLKVKYYPEAIKTIAEDGSCIYTRCAIADETIYLNRKSALPIKLLKHRLRVNFTYDKKSLVKVEDPKEDIICSKERLDTGNKHWKLAQTHEILVDEGLCIVSEMFTIFKQQKLNDRIKYVENSHLDIMCTPQGVIAMNCKSV